MNKINLLGIQVFFFLYLKYNLYLPSIIYFNGILYHSLCDYKFGIYFRKYDIICNFYFIISCHYISYQYLSNIDRVLSILIVLVNFINKKKFNKNEYIHVFFIQFYGAYIVDKHCYYQLNYKNYI